MAAAPAVPVREVIRRFWPHARPYRRWLPLVLLVLVALGPASAASSAGRRWVATITVFSRASSRTLSASQD